MNHRRIAASAAATLLVAGLGAAQVASADTSSATGRTSETPVDLRIARGYWACIAIEHLDVGTCLENPLPDLSGVPTLPDTLNDLLEALPIS